MNNLATFKDRVFDFNQSMILEECQDFRVGKTQSGTWFIFDAAKEKITAALIEDDPDSDDTAFAEALVAYGFSDIVVEHFSEIALDVIPEA